MTKDCFIVEDLLPLYEHNILHEETNEFIRNHIHECQHCSHIYEEMHSDLPLPSLESPLPFEAMMKKTMFKLTTYQIIIISLSFLLAFGSLIYSKNINFIFSYVLLGFVTYLFYRKFAYVILITFLPTFFWNLAAFYYSMTSELDLLYPSVISLFSSSIINAVIMTLIYVILALIGATISLLTINIFTKKSE